MRLRILYPCLCLLCLSCSQEQQTLNRLEGVFETTAFVVTTPDSDSVLFAAAPTFQFAECDVRDNRNGQRCAVTVIAEDGTVYDYRYGIETRGNGPEYITLRPSDGVTWEIDSDLNRSLRQRLLFELNRDELRLYSDGVVPAQNDSIQGYGEYNVSITATKR